MGPQAADSPGRSSWAPRAERSRAASPYFLGPSSPGFVARGAMYEFPRARRIRRRSEFVRIQNAPSARVPTRHLLMLLRPRESAGPARLGVVASKKVGNAVVRNRAKRLVREAFRKNPDAFPDNLDVVIILRPGAHLLPPGELEAQVRQAKTALHRRAAELAARPEEPARGPR